MWGDDAVRLWQGFGERAGGRGSGPAGGGLVRTGCAIGNIRAEEASGAKNDRSGLLELLDLVDLVDLVVPGVPGDTLAATHIDRLSRGLTCGLQVIEGLHRPGVVVAKLDQRPLGRGPGEVAGRGAVVYAASDEPAVGQRYRGESALAGTGISGYNFGNIAW